MSSIVALREFESFFITAFQSFHPHRRAGAGNDAQGKGAIRCFGPYEVPLHSRIVAAQQKLTAYASPAAHGSIGRALDLVGLDSERLRLMAVDSRQRMDVTALKQAMGADREQGSLPFWMVVEKPDGDPRWDYRREAVERIHPAVRDLLLGRARALSIPRPAAVNGPAAGR